MRNWGWRKQRTFLKIRWIEFTAETLTRTFFSFETKSQKSPGCLPSHYVAEPGLELMILLPLPPECWDYMDVPLCPAFIQDFWLQNLCPFHITRYSIQIQSPFPSCQLVTKIQKYLLISVLFFCLASREWPYFSKSSQQSEEVQHSSSLWP
jgi:hypothetical protein